MVESLVALTVLMMALVAALGAIEAAFTYAEEAEDRVTAYYLAQDAMEYIRNVRDENMLTTPDVTQWLKQILPTCKIDTSVTPNVGGCLVDTTVKRPEQGLQNCSAPCFDPTSTSKVLKMATRSGVFVGYGHEHPSALFGNTDITWTPTKFYRYAVVTEGILDAGNKPLEVSVTVLVNWKGKGGANRQYSVRENVFRWQEDL